MQVKGGRSKQRPYQPLISSLSRLTAYVALVSLRGTRLALGDAAWRGRPLSIA
jgi:hypothetical protein